MTFPIAWCIAPLASLLPLPQGDSPAPADTLAVVGSAVITAADLSERIDLMPFPGKDRPGETDSLKIRALESMVAERLLAEEAAVRGIGFDSVTALRLAGLERAFVRDELYKKEVAAGVEITPEEIESGSVKYARQLRCVLFRCSTEESARIVSLALRRGNRDIDSLSPADFNRRLLSRDTVTMNFGMPDESLEEPAFSLDPAHRVSPPVNSPSLGWVVIAFVDARLNPAAAAQSMTERMIAVKNTIRRRKEQARGIRYIASFLDRLRAEADRDVLGLLGRTLHGMILSDTAAHRSEGRYMITPGEIDRLEELLRGDLSRTLIRMPGKGLTLGEAIQSFRMEPFSTPSLGGRMFAAVLNESVKRIAREEFLSREGYRVRLEESPGVRHDMETWRTSWLSNMVQADDGPGVELTEEEEVRGLIEYARFLSPAYQVSVREVLTDSLAKARRYRDMILAGRDMGDLARRFSRRKGWSERGGVSGFFYVRSFPELGVRALLADSGRLEGPVEVAGGYSLFTVLGKRLPEGAGTVTVDSLRRAIHDVIGSEKRRREKDAFIAGLARKFGVTMFYDRLKSVSLFGHAMFTRRYIGFGGMMNAAPLLQPEWGWVHEYAGGHSRIP